MVMKGCLSITYLLYSHKFQFFDVSIPHDYN